jgi:hypothetical protein
MKVIFLDNDGVICLSTEWGGRFKKQEKAGRKMSQSVNSLDVKYRFDNFNKKAIAILNAIIEETGAEIVVSSDWKKHATLEELGDYYEAQGIIKRPIDVTAFCRDLYNDGGAAHLKDEDINWTRQWMLEQERHVEILEWLTRHPEVTHWVAIDDLNMAENYDNIERTWGLENFVLTPRALEGIKQSGIREQVLKFLK